VVNKYIRPVWDAFFKRPDFSSSKAVMLHCIVHSVIAAAPIFMGVSQSLFVIGQSSWHSFSASSGLLAVSAVLTYVTGSIELNLVHAAGLATAMLLGVAGFIVCAYIVHSQDAIRRLAMTERAGLALHFVKMAWGVISIILLIFLCGEIRGIMDLKEDLYRFPKIIHFCGLPVFVAGLIGCLVVGFISNFLSSLVSSAIPEVVGSCGQYENLADCFPEFGLYLLGLMSWALATVLTGLVLACELILCTCVVWLLLRIYSRLKAYV
jgi:hypothetical protein